MGWLRNNLLVGSLVVFVAAAGLLALVLGYAGLVVYSAFLSGGSILDAVLALSFPYLPIAGVLFVLAVISGLAFCAALLRRLSLPRSRRLGSAIAGVERHSPALARLDLSSLVRPPEPTEAERAENALEELKRRYVADEITEREFERKLDRLVATDSVDDARAAREREAVLESRERGRR